VNLRRARSDCKGVDRIRRDALLVVRAQLGDRRALAELVGHWHLPVWRYVRRMLSGPGLADDVSQEAWAAALKALPRLRQPERFAPWLFTIARRSVFNHLRDTSDPTEPIEADQVVGDAVGAVLDRTQVSEGLAGVPVREREVLILFYLHDLALEECAQVLGVPAGTVKSRLFRARRLLHDRLIEKGYPS
jgi:RNA polymerase sigma factor (sigma-70 family)